MNWVQTLIFAVIMLLLPTQSIVAEQQQWCRGKIDRFVRAKHQELGMLPAEEASRRTLIRRLSFDLRGLPPSWSEVDAFVNDPSETDYEKLVDRYLASPHFGERMAQFWLDLARYADSDGYHDDAERVMWPYRDWVIDAFNTDEPFDQFTIEQLAGDLLPKATLEQKIATAFHRNGPTTTEDGADPEEYRARYAVDRVNTTSTIWLGLTVQCAECHDHKYDDISTEEYYQLFAFFNQTPEQPLFRGKYAAPIIDVPNAAQARKLDAFNREIARQQASLSNIGEQVSEGFLTWRTKLLSTDIESRDSSAVMNEFLFNGRLEETLNNTGARRKAAAYRPSREGRNPKPVKGLIDGALEFSGEGDAIDLGQLVEFRRAFPFTFEAWLRYEGDGTLLSKVDENDNSRGFDVRLIAGRVKVRLIDQWPESAVQVATLGRAPANEWLHLSVTYDGSSRPDGIHIYINGEAQDLDVEIATGLRDKIRNRIPLIVGGDSNNEQSFKGIIDELRFYKWPLTTPQLAEAPNTVLQSLARTSQDDQWLRRFFRNYVNPDTLALRKELAKLQLEEEKFRQQIPKLRIMEDRSERRPTFVLHRGDFRSPTQRVYPDTPSLLPPISTTRSGKLLTRLDLAKWIVGPNQAQTARVTANRLWAEFFGQGIVSTQDDFGSQGAAPTHPELLNWLTAELIRSQWNIKSLIRQIVLSATYRQASSTSPEMWKRDPNNRYLARGTRRRLSAEALRDNALEISGLLSHRIGGPSVRPYQPAGLWREMSKGDDAEKAYVPSHGEDLYRRGVYTFWKRSIHYPAFSVFDAPSREVCTSTRPITNTPTQVLTLLNDPTFVEAARVFAARIVCVDQDIDSRIHFAYQTALGRPAMHQELATMRGVEQGAKADYAKSPAQALRLSSVGESKIGNDLDPVELATWTAIAQMILSLDETITKE